MTRPLIITDCDEVLLHMVGEPEIALDVGAAPMAHARIDDWAAAEAWIAARLAEGPAPENFPTIQGACI